MAEARIGYKTYTRKRRHDTPQKSYIKKAILRQTAVCAAVLSAVILMENHILPESSFSRNAACFILNENTDFKARWEDAKSFFSRQIKMTGLLKGDLELDPVRNLTAPVIGEVYQGFGMEKDENTGSEEFCYGVKVKLSEKAKISCAANGTVAETGEHKTYGNYILVKHSEKIYTFYANLGEVLPKQDDVVNSGQVIATAAVSEKEGFSMLYFELRDGESMLNPETFIDFSGGGAA